jgi:hypothetical protein
MWVYQIEDFGFLSVMDNKRVGINKNNKNDNRDNNRNKIIKISCGLTSFW